MLLSLKTRNGLSLTKIKQRYDNYQDIYNKILNGGQELIHMLIEMERECRQMSKNRPYADAMELFKKYISQYATDISNKIPSGYFPAKIDHRTDIKLSERDLRTLCFIVNTAEYVPIFRPFWHVTGVRGGKEDDGTRQEAN